LRVEIDHLHFGYESSEKEILRGVSLNIKENSKFALMGKNGSGKTTLLRLAAGSLQPDGGEVFLRGEDGQKIQPAPHLIGFAPEKPEEYFFARTVREEVEFYPKNLNLDFQKQAERAMEKVGISHLRDRSPFSLSAGEGRLVSLASVLAGDPQVLVLDEPSRGLHRRGEEEVGEIIEQSDRTVIFSTHSSQLAYRFAEKVAFLKSGQVIRQGEAQKTLTDEELLQGFGLRVPGIVKWWQENRALLPEQEEGPPSEADQLASLLKEELGKGTVSWSDLCSRGTEGRR